VVVVVAAGVVVEVVVVKRKSRAICGLCMLHLLYHLSNYRILRTIRRTLIFKQFFKKITFLPFLLLDCKARLKKILSL
jgi:hypothetical protein